MSTMLIVFETEWNKKQEKLTPSRLSATVYVSMRIRLLAITALVLDCSPSCSFSIFLLGAQRTYRRAISIDYTDEHDDNPV